MNQNAGGQALTMQVSQTNLYQRLRAELEAAGVRARELSENYSRGSVDADTSADLLDRWAQEVDNLDAIDRAIDEGLRSGQLTGSQYSELLGSSSNIGSSLNNGGSQLQRLTMPHLPFSERLSETLASIAAVRGRRGRSANSARRLSERVRRNRTSNRDSGTNVRRDRPPQCIVGRHRELKNRCRQYGMQSHHIVPDRYVRDGVRSSGAGRILSVDDGPAICVRGNAFVGGTHHAMIHADIEATLASRANGAGTMPLRDVMSAVIRASAAHPNIAPCIAHVLRELTEAFAGKDLNQEVRITRR
ncbi:MAG: hypothetical protein IPK82_18990 [Polyangiaceae bacterium]|nr:hypothetical protein [Polyangiaceae bacterium]